MSQQMLTTESSDLENLSRENCILSKTFETPPNLKIGQLGQIRASFSASSKTSVLYQVKSCLISGDKRT